GDQEDRGRRRGGHRGGSRRGDGERGGRIRRSLDGGAGAGAPVPVRHPRERIRGGETRMSRATVEMYRLGPVEAIPAGEGREYRVEGQAVAVFRTRNGEVFAAQAR